MHVCVLSILCWCCVGCASQIDLQKLAERCDSEECRRQHMGNVRDVAELQRIVYESEDEHVQRAALRRIRDTEVLIAITMADQVAIDIKNAAVSRISDRNALARISTEASDLQIRDLAAARRKDISAKALRDIKSRDHRLRSFAVLNIDDQALLSKIAIEDRSPHVRSGAVARLSDQQVLAQVALDDSATEVRLAAVERIVDPVLLARVAMQERPVGYFRSHDTDVWVAALEKLDDQAHLAEVALNAPSSVIRENATRRLSNQDVLKRIVVTDDDSSVLSTAVYRITDQQWLKNELARQLEHKPVSFHRAGWLTTLFHKIDDREFMVRLAQEGDSVTRQYAADSLLSTDNDGKYTYAPYELIDGLIELKLITLDPVVHGELGYIKLKVYFSSKRTQYTLGELPFPMADLKAVTYALWLKSERNDLSIRKIYSSRAERSETFRIGDSGKTKIIWFKPDEFCEAIADKVSLSGREKLLKSTELCLRKCAEATLGG